MKIILLILLVIYIVIFAFVAIAAIFKVTGLLIFICIILLIVLTITLMYISIYFKNKSNYKKLIDLNIKNKEKLITSQIRITNIARVFPYLNTLTKQTLVMIFMIIGDLENARKSFNSIKVKKIKDKSTLLSYFMLALELAFYENDLAEFTKYSYSFNKVTESNKEIYEFENNYLNLIRIRHNDKTVDLNKTYDYFLKITKENKYDELFLLYVSKLTNKELTEEQTKKYKELGVNTYFNNL